MRRVIAVGAVVVGLVLTACSGATGDDTADGATGGRPSSAVSTPAPSTSTQAASSSPRSSSSAPPSASSSPSQTPTPSPTRPTTPAVPAVAQLPLGGTRILPNYRVVAYYGAPFNDGLGVLGHGTPEAAAQAIRKTAAGYAGYGKKVQPAMELIATVAQGSPGPDGDYSNAVSEQDVRRYLAVAKAHRMLLVLDFQPGRGEFLPQVQQFADVIADPWVGVALDPEWKVGPGQRPAQVIGSASAASINAVSDWLARFTAARHLPQKLFVVHQFTLSMLPDRQNIVAHSQLATVLHADGHGSIPVKRTVYGQLAFPAKFGAGFKLFYDEDQTLMTPAQVMALPRRPDLVTYQ